MPRSLLALSVTACAALFASGGLDARSTPEAPLQERTNTVFVTALEENGGPVVDLDATDFTVKEDGKDRDVLRAELSRVPMQIAIIVDDNGTGIFRSGLISFVQLLQGRADDLAQQRRRTDAQTGRLHAGRPEADAPPSSGCPHGRARPTAASCSKVSSRRRGIRRSARRRVP